jgi:hypothetical protein
VTAPSAGGHAVHGAAGRCGPASCVGRHLEYVGRRTSRSASPSAGVLTTACGTPPGDNELGRSIPRPVLLERRRPQPGRSGAASSRVVTMAAQTVDVLVVGAGPTGLTMAAKFGRPWRTAATSRPGTGPGARVTSTGDSATHARGPCGAGNHRRIGRVRQPDGAAPATRPRSRDNSAVVRPRSRRHRLPLPTVPVTSRDRAHPRRPPRSPTSCR